MNNHKLADFFTDPINIIPNFTTIEIKIPLEISNNLNGPIHNNLSRENVMNVFIEVIQSNLHGTNHILLEKYQKTYGDNDMLSNILIPAYELNAQMAG